jgi:transcriptional regulator with PAS, ATPase and Fis domain
MQDLSAYMNLPSPVTVCDAQGIVLFMNPASIRQFEKDGGAGLIGKNLFDCHAPASARMMREMIESGSSNVYTVEKKGKKKFVYQTPWRGDDGKVGGLVEISVELPENMPHIVRGQA